MKNLLPSNGKVFTEPLPGKDLCLQSHSLSTGLYDTICYTTSQTEKFVLILKVTCFGLNITPLSHHFGRICVLEVLHSFGSVPYGPRSLSIFGLVLTSRICMKCIVWLIVQNKGKVDYVHTLLRITP
jgi:hypothetical protein